jgi:hypothetical protein
MFLQIIEERHDQRCIELVEHQCCRLGVQPRLCERQQESEGVAIRADRMRTGLPLLHQPLSEEPFQQGSEAGGVGGGRHARPPLLESYRRHELGQALRTSNNHMPR